MLRGGTGLTDLRKELEPQGRDALQIADSFVDSVKGCRGPRCENFAGGDVRAWSKPLRDRGVRRAPRVGSCCNVAIIVDERTKLLCGKLQSPRIFHCSA